MLTPDDIRYMAYSGEGYNGVIGELTEIQQEILVLIQQRPTITISDMGKKLTYSIRNISYIINGLKELGYIERIGSRKSGKWNVLK